MFWFFKSLEKENTRRFLKKSLAKNGEAAFFKSAPHPPPAKILSRGRIFYAFTSIEEHKRSH